MKQEINYNNKGKPRNHSNTWRLNSILLSNEWVTYEIKKEMKNYLKTNENEHKTTHYLLDTAKAVLRTKFIILQAYLKKQEKISNKQFILTHKRTKKNRENPRVKPKEGNNKKQRRNK